MSTKQLEQAVRNYAKGASFDAVRDALGALAAEDAPEGAVLSELKAIRVAVEADRRTVVDATGEQRSRIILPLRGEVK